MTQKMEAARSNSQLKETDKFSEKEKGKNSGQTNSNQLRENIRKIKEDWPLDVVF